MCIDVEWKSGCLCFMSVKEAWAELPHSWFENDSCCVCIEDLEALFVWCNLWNIHRPQEFKVHLSVERLEFEAKEMDETVERLWLFYSLLSW